LNKQGHLINHKNPLISTNLYINLHKPVMWNYCCSLRQLGSDWWI